LLNAVCQPLDGRAAFRMGSNVFDILSLDAGIPNFLRIQNDIWAGLTTAKAGM